MADIPIHTAEELDIDPALVQPMGHGGHSLVFSVPAAKGIPGPSVLKIFRFTLPQPPSSSSSVFQYTGPRDPDYAYFLSEHSSYSRLLSSSSISSLYTPAVHATVSLSPSFERTVLSQIYNPGLHRRRRQSQLRLQPDQVLERLPLKALLIEYIPGLRLSAFRRIPPAISKKIADGITHIHSLGILHRDIKKRNVMIVPNNNVPISSTEDSDDANDVDLDGTEKVVWIDFSNSLVLSDFNGTEDEQTQIFNRLADSEMQEVNKMVARLER